MAPEYGATCGIFPVDAETIRYLELTGRPAEHIRLVEAYFKEMGLFHTAETPEARYSDTLELDLSTVEPSLAGPKRPQDRGAAAPGQGVVPEGAEGHARREAEAAAQAGLGGGDRDDRPQERAAARGRRRRRDRRRRRGPDLTVGRLPAAPGRLHHARLGRHRGDHQLHQHVEPVGDGRRRAAGQEGGRAAGSRPSRGSRRASPPARRS